MPSMGLIRTLLAISVVLAHSGIVAPGVDGYVSVLMFFAISGFYMGLILNEKYDRNGQFFLARYLRLWPSYIVVFVAIYVLVRPLPDYKPFELLVYMWTVSLSMFGYETLSWFNYRPGIGLTWLANVNGAIVDGKPVGAMVWSTGMAHMWSVSIELVFYLAAPFVARKPARLITAFILSYAVHLYLVASFEFEAPIRYRSALNYFWIFFAGMIAYWVWRHIRIDWKSIVPSYPVSAALGVVVAFLCLSAIRWGLVVGRDSLLPDFGLLLFALSIGPIFEATRRVRLDRMIGELSFPLYLVHWPLTYFVMKNYRGEWSGALMILAASLVLAAALYFLVDRQVDKLRQTLIAPRPVPAE